MACRAHPYGGRKPISVTSSPVIWAGCAANAVSHVSIRLVKDGSSEGSCLYVICGLTQRSRRVLLQVSGVVEFDSRPDVPIWAYGVRYLFTGSLLVSDVDAAELLEPAVLHWYLDRSGPFSLLGSPRLISWCANICFLQRFPFQCTNSN